jgi:hypothetical protein
MQLMEETVRDIVAGLEREDLVKRTSENVYLVEPT